MNIPSKIITHHAVSSTAHTAQDVDAWHKLRWLGFVSKYFKNAKGEPYHVGYHYVIEWDGKLVQTRELFEEGAHCIGMNNSSIGVCFMGNFDIHMPSPEQLASWKKLYTDLVLKYPVLTPNNCVPHRKYANKLCHGKLLSDDYFAKLVAQDPAELKQKLFDLQAQLVKLQNLLKRKKNNHG